MNAHSSLTILTRRRVFYRIVIWYISSGSGHQCFVKTSLGLVKCETLSEVLSLFIAMNYANFLSLMIHATRKRNQFYCFTGNGLDISCPRYRVTSPGIDKLHFRKSHNCADTTLISSSQSLTVETRPFESSPPEYQVHESDHHARDWEAYKVLQAANTVRRFRKQITKDRARKRKGKLISLFYTVCWNFLPFVVDFQTYIYFTYIYNRCIIDNKSHWYFLHPISKLSFGN